MLIEHTSRSTENKPKITLNLISKICVVVRYGGQQDASTNKVSIRSANQKCHTTLSDSYISQPKVNESQHCPNQRSIQNSSSKKSMQYGQSQWSTSISVPENVDYRNRNFDQSWSQFEHVLTKVNAGQICAETLGQNRNFPLLKFPTCERRRASKVIEPIK